MTGPLILTPDTRVDVVPPPVPRLVVPPPDPDLQVAVVPVVGPRGPKGDPGGGVSVHVQSEPSEVWIVDHDLGRRPVAWSLYDDQDQLRDEYLVEHPTLNRAVIRMDVPTAGTITLI